LYSENDRYFGRERPMRWFDGFVEGGGIARFVQLPPFGDDGHGSFTRNVEAWRPVVEDFLSSVGF
jgi:hypothetical protein